MLEKHQLKTLSDAVSEVWKNVNFAKVNGLDVRFRVIKDQAANFHVHANSEELFCRLERDIDLGGSPNLIYSYSSS